MIDFREWVHGGTPNLEGLDGKRIWFCDVCPTIDQLKDKFARSKFVDIKDHHNNPSVQAVLKESALLTNVKMTLETGDRCGALMLYNALYPATSEPAWLDAINKGDTGLILSRTDDEKAYHAWITRSEAMTSVTTFRAALAEDMKTATAAGVELLASRKAECEKAFSNLKCHFYTGPDGKQGLAAYATASGPQMISQVSEYIWTNSKKPLSFDFLAIQWTRDKVPQLSLRSPPNSSFDVSAIARRNGGNGHPAASGVQNRLLLE